MLKKKVENRFIFAYLVEETASHYSVRTGDTHDLWEAGAVNRVQLCQGCTQLEPVVQRDAEDRGTSHALQEGGAPAG